MPKRVQRLLLVSLLAVPLAACGQSSGPASDATPQASPKAVISVVSDATTIGAYAPPSASIKAGDTVQWTFIDKNPHSVTADDNTLFDSMPQADGRTFAFRFDKPGSYAYHCSIHPEMHGTVLVG